MTTHERQQYISRNVARRPRIGVTGPEKNHRISWRSIAVNLFLAGADMVHLTPGHPQFGTALDGIIISGGRDIDPLHYGKERKPDYQYDAARDDLEIRWTHWALDQGIPLFGICRGAQMMNVCLGGSLHLDIKLICEKALYPNTILSKIFVRKPIVVQNGSLLHHILACEVLQVNSLHRQSIDSLGKGLVVSAQEENGIIQAIENQSHERFLLGVQWHPEFMLNSYRQRRIFHTFVLACRGNHSNPCQPSF